MRLHMAAVKGFTPPPPVTYYPRIVVVGDLNNIAYSDDGAGWTSVYKLLGTTSNFVDVAFSPEINQWIVITDYGQILTSANGIQWTLRTHPLGSPSSFASMTSVAWCGLTSKWVIIADTVGVVLTSPDGITWTSSVASYAGGAMRPGFISRGPGGTLLGIPGGNRKIPNDSYNTIFTSNDGITWTLWQTLSNTKPAASFYEPALGFAGEVGYFNFFGTVGGSVAAADSDGAGVMNSTVFASGGGADRIRRISYSPLIGKWIVAWQESGILSISSGPNPVTSSWSYVAASAYPFYNNEVVSLEKPGAPLFIAAGWSGDNTVKAIKTSPNGTTWTERDVPGFKGQSSVTQIRGIAAGRFTKDTLPLPLDTFEDGLLSKWDQRNAQFISASDAGPSPISGAKSMRWVSGASSGAAWMNVPPAWFVHKRGDAVRGRFNGISVSNYAWFYIHATFNATDANFPVVNAYAVSITPATLFLYDITGGTKTQVGSMGLASGTDSSEVILRLCCFPSTDSIAPNQLRLQQLNRDGAILQTLNYTTTGVNKDNGVIGVSGEIVTKGTGDWYFDDFYLDSKAV